MYGVSIIHSQFLIVFYSNLQDHYWVKWLFQEYTFKCTYKLLLFCTKSAMQFVELLKTCVLI